MKEVIFVLFATLVTITVSKLDIKTLLNKVSGEVSLKSTDRTLTYFFSDYVGNAIVPEIQQESKISKAHTFCVDIKEKHSNIIEFIDEIMLTRNDDGAIIIIHNVEKLDDNQISSLSFLHSATDANSKYANLVIIFIWDTIHSPPTANMDDDTFIHNFISKSSRKINVNALVGRISSISLLTPPSNDEISSEEICRRYANNRGTHNQTSNLTTFMIIALVTVVYLISYKTSNSKNNSNITNSNTNIANNNAQVNENTSAISTNNGTSPIAIVNQQDESVPVPPNKVPLNDISLLNQTTPLALSVTSNSEDLDVVTDEKGQEGQEEEKPQGDISESKNDFTAHATELSTTPSHTHNLRSRVNRVNKGNSNGQMSSSSPSGDDGDNERTGVNVTTSGGSRQSTGRKVNSKK